MCFILQLGLHNFCFIGRVRNGFSIACYLFSFTVYFGDFIHDIAARLRGPLL